VEKRGTRKTAEAKKENKSDYINTEAKGEACGRSQMNEIEKWRRRKERQTEQTADCPKAPLPCREGKKEGMESG